MRILANLLLVLFWSSTCQAGQEILQYAKTRNAKPPCSLSIRLRQDNVKSGSSVDIEVTKTNTSDRALNNSRSTNAGENYLFEVRRNGVPAAETSILRRLKKPGSKEPEEKEEGLAGRYRTSYVFEELPPHQTFEETVSVSEFYDMTQPGEYTVQIRQGTVRSNVVTIIVNP